MASKEKGPNRNTASAKNLSKFIKKKKRDKEKADELRTCEEKEDEVVGSGGNLSGSKKKLKKKHKDVKDKDTVEENIVEKDSTQKQKKKKHKEGKDKDTVEENIMEKDGTQRTKKKKHDKEGKEKDKDTVEENVLDKDGTQKTKKKVDDTKRGKKKKSSRRAVDRHKDDKKDDKKDDDKKDEKKDKDDKEEKDKRKEKDEKTSEEPNTVFEAIKAPVHPAHSNAKHMNAHFLKDLKKLQKAEKEDHDDKSKEKKKKDSGDDHKKPKTPPQIPDEFLPTVFEHVNAPVAPADAEKKIKRSRHHHKDKDKDKDAKDPKAIIANAPESEAIQSIQGEVVKPVYQTLPKKEGVTDPFPPENAAVSMYAPDGLAVMVAKVDGKDVPSTQSAIEASKFIDPENAEANTRTAMVPIKNIAEVHYRLVIYNGVKRYEPILPKDTKEKDKDSQEISEERPTKKSQKRSKSPQNAESCLVPVVAKSSAENANKPVIEILPGTSPSTDSDPKKDAKEKDSKTPELAPMSMYVAPINEDKNRHSQA